MLSVAVTSWYCWTTLSLLSDSAKSSETLSLNAWMIVSDCSLCISMACRFSSLSRLMVLLFSLNADLPEADFSKEDKKLSVKIQEKMEK